MGWIRSAARAAISGPLSGLATPEKWVEDWFSGGIVNSSGVRVDYDTALTYSAFFAGVRVISEDVAGLPLHLYQRLERGKRRATEHPLYTLLHDQPNPMMSSQQLRETLMGHALMWGNGVAQVVSNPRTGVIEEIWPLRPDRLKIKAVRSGPGRFVRIYQYRDDVNGIYATLLPGEVLHIPGLGFDGVKGYSVVEYAANSIGLGLATEHHGAKFFSNGSTLNGVLSHPGQLSDEARKRMRADWENLHRGIDRAHRIAILEEGVTWQQIGIPNDAAQFLETRKLQVTEMARWLRLPPHKIGDLERATFSNIEQQQIDYVTSALRAWLVRWEQAINTQLLLPEERRTYFAEHLVEALLRGDTQARYQAYAIGRQWGWLSTNDVREKENLNPVDGGDVYLQPLNMVPAGSTGAAPERGRRHARLLSGRAVADQYAPLIEAADAKVAALEAKRVGALVDEHLTARGRRSLAGFLAALQVLYAEDGPIAEAAAAAFLPVLTSFAADVAAEAAEVIGYEGEVDLSVWAQAYTLSHIAYRLASSFGQLRRTAEEADVDAIADDVLARLAAWQAERPARTARWEGTQLTNAARRETWKAAGVRRLKWVASGDTCPYCRRLDGKVVGIDDAFLAKGEEIDGDDGERLVVKRTTRHPPVHVGCDCQVVPA
ncbi:phage portal protein [uncultured Thermomonospora sp.]|uniref:phage portal protein n=1 Tax=uncultured Thermomonospora sp. TaxID=671175 RepID=UPI00259BE679|nr:phage portal protein [uncultured Thermomonospora sp.]